MGPFDGPIGGTLEGTEYGTVPSYLSNEPAEV